jgi:hypothetical protein
MVGNCNSGRRKSERDFAAMVRIAVTEIGATGQPKLRELADVLVAQALQGEGWALKEVADRLDGKPVAKIADVSNTFDDWDDESLDAAIELLRANLIREVAH